jgi:hypothetical protein
MREKLSRRIIKEKKAASPAISMVIITAATVVLVLVAGSFATLVLDRQQAETEFNALQKSIFALDDAIRDVAWKEGASRSVRFTTSKGSFREVPSTRSMEINFNGENLESFDTSVIEYVMSDSYISLEKEQDYIDPLGKADLMVFSVSDSLAQVSLEHKSGFAIISLGYRLRILDEGIADVIVEGTKTTVNYVNIYIIALSSPDFSGLNGPFDLVARNTGVSTVTKIRSTSGNNSISIELNGASLGSESLNLDQEKVIFNLIISKVSVST